MIFFYLPALGLIHFLSASALGIMSVFSGKAIRDMFVRERDAQP